MCQVIVYGHYDQLNVPLSELNPFKSMTHKGEKMWYMVTDTASQHQPNPTPQLVIGWEEVYLFVIMIIEVADLEH